MAVFEGESESKLKEIVFSEIIMRYKFARKPTKCPKCGSGQIADILYGYPEFSKELQKDLDEGKLVLGGCCVSGGDPKWKCVDCEADLYPIIKKSK